MARIPCSTRFVAVIAASLALTLLRMDWTVLSTHLKRPLHALLLIAWLLAWPLYLRTIAISLLFAALLVPGIGVLVGPGWRAEYSLRSVALTLIMAAGSLLLRAVHASRHPEDYQNLLQSSLGQGLTFLFSFICLIGAGFGFVLANFERIARRMEDIESSPSRAVMLTVPWPSQAQGSDSLASIACWAMNDPWWGRKPG